MELRSRAAREQQRCWFNLERGEYPHNMTIYDVAAARIMFFSFPLLIFSVISFLPYQYGKYLMLAVYVCSSRAPWWLSPPCHTKWNANIISVRHGCCSMARRFVPFVSPLPTQSPAICDMRYACTLSTQFACVWCGWVVSHNNMTIMRCAKVDTSPQRHRATVFCAQSKTVEFAGSLLRWIYPERSTKLHRDYMDIIWAKEAVFMTLARTYVTQSAQCTTCGLLFAWP